MVIGAGDPQWAETMPRTVWQEQVGGLGSFVRAMPLPHTPVLARIRGQPVTPNEHDDPTAARESGDERAEDLANGAAAPDSAAPTAGGTSNADGSEEGRFAEDAQFTPYLNSGANPFSSVHPPGEGVFPRLTPREFPQDEPPADVPSMEQLPDPNALPELGYPVMAGYQQTFPPAASAFPPAPSAFPAEPAASPPNRLTHRRATRTRPRARRKPPLRSRLRGHGTAPLHIPACALPRIPMRLRPSHRPARRHRLNRSACRRGRRRIA